MNLARTVAISILLVVAASFAAIAMPLQQIALWRSDPAWHQGKAEWALYEAERVIYGKPRRYEATIFTNKELVDLATTAKTEDPATPGALEVFKHNVSELIPTENYTYRFLTTCFVRTDDLSPYKIVMSSQEDCGATYKQFVIVDEKVRAQSFSYFPGTGATSESYAAPDHLAFHDALTLTLRDYPFDAVDKPLLMLQLVADQTDNRDTPPKPAMASVEYIGREMIRVPYGSIETHHLQVAHAEAGGSSQSDYWFAAAPHMRNVLVKYAGPYGLTYELKKLDWWAYWKDPRPA